MSTGERPQVDPEKVVGGQRNTEEAEGGGQGGDAGGGAGTPTPAPRPLVSPEQEFGQAVSVSLSGLQRAALGLAIGVGVLITLVTAVAVLDWMIGGPTMPANLGQNGEDAAKQIDNYAAMREADLTRPKDLFQTVVLNGLLPIFTLLLGYLFGRQEA